MDVVRSKDFTRKVKPNEIHGSFPYKLYLEIYGTNLFGRYIVIAGDEEIELDDHDEIRLHFNDTDDKVAKECNFLAHRVDYLTVKRADVAIWVYMKDTSLPVKPKKQKIKKPKIKKSEDKVKMEQSTRKNIKMTSHSDVVTEELNAIGEPIAEKEIMVYDENDIKEANAPTDKKLAEIKKLDTLSKYFSVVHLWVYYVVMGLIAFSLIALIHAFPDKMWMDYMITCGIAVSLFVGSYYACRAFRIRHDSLKVKKLPIWKKLLLIITSLILCFIVVIYLGVADAFKDGNELAQQFQEEIDREKEEMQKQQDALPKYDTIDDIDAAIQAGDIVIQDPTEMDTLELDTNANIEEMSNTAN